jgi:tetratricopeptide (TPR) repeat protein
LEDAEEKFSAALSIRVRHLGELSFPVATVYAYLAEVYRIRGESEETLQCYEKTISILEELKNQIENTMKIQSEAIEQKIENELETNRNESSKKSNFLSSQTLKQIQFEKCEV